LAAITIHSQNPVSGRLSAVLQVLRVLRMHEWQRA